MSKTHKELADTPHLEITDEMIVARILVSVAVGLVIAGLFHLTLGRRKSENSLTMPLTLVMLSLLVCMVMLIVNGSLAMAFALGGALTLIRYRTTVDDTRDTAFVIASVVCGMGAGVGQYAVIIMGLPTFAIVLFVAFAYGLGRNGGGPTHKLTIRIAPDVDPEQITAAAFATLPRPPALLGIETAKQGTAIDVMYSLRQIETTALLKLMTALRAVEGVQAVEVKPG